MSHIRELAFRFKLAGLCYSLATIITAAIREDLEESDRRFCVTKSLF